MKVITLPSSQPEHAYNPHDLWIGIVLLAIMSVVMGTLIGYALGDYISALFDWIDSTPTYEWESHTVQPGETLWAIASARVPDRDPRETIHLIRQQNGMDSALVRSGQVIMVPAGEEGI